MVNPEGVSAVGVNAIGMNAVGVTAVGVNVVGVHVVGGWTLIQLYRNLIRNYCQRRVMIRYYYHQFH